MDQATIYSGGVPSELGIIAHVFQLKNNLIISRFTQLMILHINLIPPTQRGVSHIRCECWEYIVVSRVWTSWLPMWTYCKIAKKPRVLSNRRIKIKNWRTLSKWVLHGIEIIETEISGYSPVDISDYFGHLFIMLGSGSMAGKASWRRRSLRLSYVPIASH